MEALMSDLINEMRIAIDEVNHDEVNDIIMDDSDMEMKQVIETAAQQILLQAPEAMLAPVIVKVSLGNEQDYDPIITQFTDGHGELTIPSDFVRLYELKLFSWQSSVRELMDPTSKEAQMQASRWTRGTPQKPKAMLSVNQYGNRVIVYWTAGRYLKPIKDTSIDQVYDHRIERFSYIPMASIDKTDDGEKLVAALHPLARKHIVYRAISVFLTSKKEADLAEKYFSLSQF